MTFFPPLFPNEIAKSRANVSATTAPSSTDDAASGYSVGSIWYNTTTTRAYLCLDATAGAASWFEIEKGVLNNFTATAAPTVNDDAGDGYSVGSRWFDTTGDEAYVCLDSATGAANWQTTSLTIDDLGSMATQDANNVAISGGAINGTTIGATTPAAGNFTAINSSNLTASQFVKTDASKNLESISNQAAREAILIGTSKTIEAKTTDYTLLSSDSGKKFTNYGAASAITFTLPSSLANEIFEFERVADYALKIQAQNGLVIRSGNSSTATNGYFNLLSIASSIEIEATNSYWSAALTAGSASIDS